MKVCSILETRTANEISQPGFDRLTNLPFNLRSENAAAFVLSAFRQGTTKRHSNTKESIDRTYSDPQVFCPKEEVLLLWRQPSQG